MAGQLDSLFKNAAKSVVSQLGASLDHTITYIKKGTSSYDVDTGKQVTVNTTYSDIKVPISFIRSEEDEGREIRQAKIYITPDLIGNNQIDFDDEVQFSYAGKTVTGQIYNIDTKKGGQVYLYTILVRF
tara:strand:- start:1369 stop:1755 length:387 start_codon:yes stop_codon:yes gene_type:complete